MITFSKTQRRWLIGGLGTLAGLVLLCGLGLFAFVKFMEALTKVPPESTQITLYNATNERLSIEKFIYGQEDITKKGNIIIDTEHPDKYSRFQIAIFRDQLEIIRSVSIDYIGLNSGIKQHIDGIIERIPGRPCGFVIILRDNGGEVSKCGYNELQDFDGD